MKIKAKCTYDYNAVRALIHVTMFKKNNPKTQYIGTAVYCAVMLAAVLSIGFVFGWKKSLFILLAVDLIIFAICNYSYFLLPKIAYKNISSFAGIENEYIFLDDVFKTFSKTSEYNGEAELKYSLVPKVIENSRYFFIYQDKAQAYVVDKSAFEGGTAEELRRALQPKINGKYIICKY